MTRMTFSKALFISLLWHVFCFFAIIIVITPVNKSIEKFSKINFIGSILDKDMPLYYKQKNSVKSYSRDNAYKIAEREYRALDTAQEKRTKIKENEMPYIPRPYNVSISEIIKEDKILVGNLVFPAESLDRKHTPEVKSEAAGRHVLFNPPPPVIDKAFRIGKTPAKGEKFQIKLRFLVSPKGKVIFIEKIKSCGYIDIDLLAVRYMQKWQFAALTPDEPQVNQEGILLLELEAQ